MSEELFIGVLHHTSACTIKETTKEIPLLPPEATMQMLILDENIYKVKVSQECLLTESQVPCVASIRFSLLCDT